MTHIFSHLPASFARDNEVRIAMYVGFLQELKRSIQKAKHACSRYLRTCLVDGARSYRDVTVIRSQTRMQIFVFAHC